MRLLGHKRGKEIMLSKGRNYWVLLFAISFGVFNFVAPSRSNTYDGEFYKDIEAIIVETSFNQNQTDSLLKDLLNSGAHQPSKQQLNQWTVEAVQKRLKTRKAIKVAAGENSYVSLEEKNKLYLYFGFTLWDKDNFSPELNYPVMLVTIQYKRKVHGQEEHVREIFDTPLLLSLPESKNDSEEAIQNALGQYLKKNLMPYVNCSNGGSCKDAR
jgi:hypothetical protein